MNNVKKCNKYNECGGYFISTKTGKCELKKVILN